METKVNKELYQEVKKSILEGNYTIGEVSTTLHWIRVEYANKQDNAAEEIRAREVEGKPDQYGIRHQFENGPDRKD